MLLICVKSSQCLSLHQDHEHKSVAFIECWCEQWCGVVVVAKSALRQSQSQLYPHMNTFFHLRPPSEDQSCMHAYNHTSSRLEIIYIKSFMKASTIDVTLKKSRTFYPMFCSEMHSEPSFIWHFQVETFGYKKLWMGFQLIVAHCSRAAVAGVHLLLFLAAAAIVSPEYIWNNSPHSPRLAPLLYCFLYCDILHLPPTLSPGSEGD